jgi:hypothetical protein
MDPGGTLPMPIPGGTMPVLIIWEETGLAEVPPPTTGIVVMPPAIFFTRFGIPPQAHFIFPQDAHLAILFTLLLHHPALFIAGVELFIAHSFADDLSSHLLTLELAITFAHLLFTGFGSLLNHLGGA